MYAREALGEVPSVAQLLMSVKYSVMWVLYVILFPFSAKLYIFTKVKIAIENKLRFKHG